jgi:hypothetical protein
MHYYFIINHLFFEKNGKIGKFRNKFEEVIEIIRKFSYNTR